MMIVLLLTLTALASVFASLDTRLSGPITLPLRTERHHTRSGMDKRATNVNASVDHEYIYYWVSMELGTPPQTLEVNMDTGSPSLVVSSFDCSGCGLKSGYPGFNYARSTTYTTRKQPGSEEYASGEVMRGVWANDTVAFGGFQIPNFEFLQVNTSNSYELELETYGEGILGLGWKWPASYSSKEAHSLTQVMSSQWMDPQFGIYLGRLAASDLGGAGLTENSELTLGGIDSTKFDGNISYSALQLYPGFSDIIQWLIKDVGIKKRNNNFSYVSVPTTLTVVDTGAPGITLPLALARAFFQDVPGAIELRTGSWAAPCNSTDLDLTIAINGIDYTVPSSDLIYPLGQVGNMCNVLLIGSSFDRSTDTWSIGAPFLRNVYSAWRYNPPAVGFAKLKPEWNVVRTLNGSLSASASASNSLLSTSTSATPPPNVTVTVGPSSGLVRGSGDAGAAATSSAAVANKSNSGVSCHISKEAIALLLLGVFLLH